MRHIHQSVWTAAAMLFIVAGPTAQHAGHPTAGGPSATATLKTAEGRTVGEAMLRETPNGVLVHLKLKGVPAGTRAFHMHTTGRCDAPSFESAGEHFNPEGAGHGFAAAKGPHAGDLPNLHIPASGELEVELLAARVTLGDGKTGLLDADGSALVLHAGPDDYSSDPAGNAGDRLACAVVTAAADAKPSR
jgi:Cu-Zn family superoxide dismutase